MKKLLILRVSAKRIVGLSGGFIKIVTSLRVFFLGSQQTLSLCGVYSCCQIFQPGLRPDGCLTELADGVSKSNKHIPSHFQQTKKKEIY